MGRIIQVGDSVRYELGKNSWDRSEWVSIENRWVSAKRKARKEGWEVPPKPRKAWASGVVLSIKDRCPLTGKVRERVDVDGVHHALILVDFGWGVRGLAVGTTMAHPMVPELGGVDEQRGIKCRDD